MSGQVFISLFGNRGSEEASSLRSHHQQGGAEPGQAHLPANPPSRFLLWAVGYSFFSDQPLPSTLTENQRDTPRPRRPGPWRPVSQEAGSLGLVSLLHPSRGSGGLL